MRSCCAALAARATKRAAMIVDRYGSTTSASPNASIALIRSTAPPPKPPASAENGRPSKPRSAMVAHTGTLNPTGEATIARRASKV